MLLAFQQQAGEAVTGNENMAGNLAEGHQIFGRLEVELGGRKIFDGLGGVLPDALPGIQ